MSTITSLFSLVAALFLLFGNKSGAQESQKLVPVHIVIVADHSGSMYRPAGYSSVQTQAIIDALAVYRESCDDVLITYLPWGSQPGEEFTAHLNVLAERHRFIRQVRHIAHTQLGATKHDLAYWQAKDILARAEQGVMIFLTDESGIKSVADTPIFTLHKIALGAVTSYLTKNFVAGYGTIHTATDIESLSKIIVTILADATQGMCLG